MTGSILDLRTFIYNPNARELMYYKCPVNIRCDRTWDWGLLYREVGDKCLAEKVEGKRRGVVEVLEGVE